jgi:nucleoside-diphosphate-sugar epimerase
MQVTVTGASGKAGRAVVADLSALGHEVLATDLTPGRPLQPGETGVQVLRADLTQYGEAVDVLHGADAVVHLANIPAPGLQTPSTTISANLAMNANVFLAAAALGLKRVVWASSETTLGLPFDTPPRYAPVDEEHYPYPTTTYALSKVASETLATHVAEWSGIPFVALRFSNIFLLDDYQRVPGFWGDARSRHWNLWGYVDQRDVAQACRRALEADVSGASSYIIAAADTIMDRPSADLLREVYPGVELRQDVGQYGTLLSIDRARSVLGYEPQHSWRDEVSS